MIVKIRIPCKAALDLHWFPLGVGLKEVSHNADLDPDSLIRMRNWTCIHKTAYRYNYQYTLQCIKFKFWQTLFFVIILTWNPCLFQTKVTTTWTILCDFQRRESIFCKNYQYLDG